MAWRLAVSAFSVTLWSPLSQPLSVNRLFRHLSSVSREDTGGGKREREIREELADGSSEMPSSSSSSMKAEASGNMLVGGDESGSPIVARAQDVVEYSDASGSSTPGIILSEMGDPGNSADSAASGSSSPSTDNSRSSSPEQQRTRTTITTSTTSGTDDGSGRQMATTVQYTGAAAVSSDVGKDGTLHIHPIPSRKDRKVKVKKVISFIPRTSHFDRFHPTSQGDPFRGFYVLFWLMMGLTMSRVLYHGYLRSGDVVGMRFAKLISEDAIVLGISDGILVGSTILSVPFMQLIQKGWIRYHYTGLVIQHVFQCIFLFTAIRWTFHRQWYWVQSGFLTLHSLTMLMKMHSYCAFNGAASEKALQLEKANINLEKAVQDKGGWSQVLVDAQREEEHKSRASHDVDTSAVSNGELSPLSPTGQSLRHRRKSSDRAARMSHQKANSEDAKDPLKLVDYSDPTINKLANQCADLEEDLISPGPAAVRYPDNLTYANYIDYLLVPTLVYELEYPRTSSIRPLYVVEKTLATFGTFFLIYAITEHVIIPHHEAAKGKPSNLENSIGIALDLVMPFMINYLLIFYIIFECICNGFAELTRFADRGFYEDWWNAVTWDEFARKWNKPVHHFLLRHVYASTIAAFRLSKFQASFVTFLLSACIHELVMAVVSKKFRFYLFMMQMMQLPMIAIGRLPLLRKNPTLGNIFFWAGLIWGFPLLAVGYLRF